MKLKLRSNKIMSFFEQLIERFSEVLNMHHHYSKLFSLMNSTLCNLLDLNSLMKKDLLTLNLRSPFGLLAREV